MILSERASKSIWQFALYVALITIIPEQHGFNAARPCFALTRVPEFSTFSWAQKMFLFLLARDQFPRPQLSPISYSHAVPSVSCFKPGVLTALCGFLGGVRPVFWQIGVPLWRSERVSGGSHGRHVLLSNSIRNVGPGKPLIRSLRCGWFTHCWQN